MAGIAFELQALTGRHDLVGAVRAYGYSTALVAGPWIFTIVALVGITAAIPPSTTWEEVQIFRSVLIYNFCASLILTGPVVMMATRFLADQIYGRDLSHASVALLAGLGVVAVLSTLVAVPFYLLLVELSPAASAMAIANFGLVSCVWITVPYLSVLRRYRRIAGAFAVTAFGAIGLTLAVQTRIDDVVMLTIFNVALAVILAMLIDQIFREYPEPLLHPIDWTGFLVRRWELAPIGLLYYLGIWIDKIVMWHVEGGATVIVGGVLRTLPDYDSAMFKCQLLAIPVFVYFFVHVETRFFFLFRTLYRSFESHLTLATIEKRAREIGRYAFERLLLILMTSLFLACFVILLADLAPGVAGLAAAQVGVFRIGLVGTCFHTTFLFGLIFLLYFDLRRATLALTALFFGSNLTLTVLLLPLGTAFHGVGYLLAGALSLLATISVLYRELQWLPYHAFITNNDSIRTERSNV